MWSTPLSFQHHSFNLILKDELDIQLLFPTLRKLIYVQCYVVYYLALLYKLPPQICRPNGLSFHRQCTLIMK